MIPDIDRQIDVMRLRWPAWRVLDRGINWALWHGRFCPSTVTYGVRMRYRVPFLLRNGTPGSVQPRVTVDGLYPNGSIGLVELPHVYHAPRSPDLPPVLCLFDPAARPTEWSADDLLADTTVHRIGQWLVFFEGWLASGRWHGGGRHPEDARTS